MRKVFCKVYKFLWILDLIFEFWKTNECLTHSKIITASSGVVDDIKYFMYVSFLNVISMIIQYIVKYYKYIKKYILNNLIITASRLSNDE